MTSFSSVRTIFVSYPETDPFAIKPTVAALLPLADFGQDYDTPALRAAALSIARARNGFNVLARTYGSNPLFVESPELEAANLPMVEYRSPQDLQEYQLPSDAQLVEVVDRSEFYYTLTVCHEGWEEPRLLKVFRKTHTNGLSEASAAYPCEREAYAHLAQRTCSSDSVVQACFGYVSLSVHTLMKMAQLTGVPAASLSSVGLLLEHMPNAQKLTMDNITIDAGHKLFRALYNIHKRYVRVGSVHLRNMRVVPSPDGNAAARVFWTDFTASKCASDSTLRRQDLFQELQDCWDLIFGRLLPAKRIEYSEAFDD